jgi:phosphomannomutase
MKYEAAAKAWLANDPDPETRAELAGVLKAADQAALADRFGSTLQFGTAGLRAELGAGPNRMNRVVVAKTALGLARFLLSNKARYQDPDGSLSVVIGFDGRINSEVFARDSAEIFAGAGLIAKLFDRSVPTPVAAYTGRALGASATVVVTASHNPPRDNGYKVYLGGPTGGSQLVPPQDSDIAKLIAALDQNFLEIEKSTHYQLLGATEIAAYQARALELIAPSAQARAELKISYTAMHGVGWSVASELFASGGFELTAVPEQRDPDGLFPTVKFPNPEEPGAMDLSFAHAETHQSDIVLANDPDADRLAVGIESADGGWKLLTGDDVGLILGELVAKQHSAGTLANSIVSANLLGAVASAHGLEFQQTLTGFKYISKVPGLVYGYEEALGYCVDPSYTPDKDGITAGLLIAELAANLKAKGSNLSEHLEQLHQRYGYLATGQVSLRVTRLAQIAELMAELRANTPESLVGESVSVQDLLKTQPETDALIFTLSGGARLIIRPSGTEPKLKCYLHSPGDSQAAAEAQLAKLTDAARSLLGLS